ncbi:MAG: hypothetical protein V4722_01160 [Bacteroidota bacterium]
MENNNPSSRPLTGDLRKELEEITKQAAFSPSFLKKKLILWAIRTALTVLLYFMFWDHSWVRWTLLLTIPLNLWGLLAIVARGYLLRKKIELMKQQLDEAGRITDKSGSGLLP